MIIVQLAAVVCLVWIQTRPYLFLSVSWSSSNSVVVLRGCKSKDSSDVSNVLTNYFMGQLLSTSSVLPQEFFHGYESLVSRLLLGGPWQYKCNPWHFSPWNNNKLKIYIGAYAYHPGAFKQLYTHLREPTWHNPQHRLCHICSASAQIVAFWTECDHL